MESYGTLLKKARESKYLTVEQVERDTTINAHYIIGLEEEDSTAFPGEPYMVGFLRNYAEYLGVNTQEVLKLYHAKQIQESPVPEGLLFKQRPPYVVPLIVAGSVLGALIIAVLVYFFAFHLPKVKSEHEQIIEQNSKSHQYELDEKGLTKRIYKGDQIILPAEDGNIILTVANTLGSLGIETPSGMQMVELSEERDIDVDADGKSELIVYLSDISSKDESRGAEVRMMTHQQGTKTSITNPGKIAAMNSNDDSIPSIDSISKTTKTTFILEDNRAYPFTVNIIFRGSCVFRYRPDRKDKIEDYFVSGDVVNFTANNYARLWMSNVNAMKVQIIANAKTYDLEVGKAGQVQAEDVKWVKDSDGKYRLVVTELD